LLKDEKEAIEEELYEKDEICKKYESDNDELTGTVKFLQSQLENMGDHKSNIMETIENERQQAV
jgi:hypothetical protein